MVGVVFAGVQGGLIRVIIPKLGQKRAVYLGLLLYSAGFPAVCVRHAQQDDVRDHGGVLHGGIAGPALQSIISLEVPPNAQGELQSRLHRIDEHLLGDRPLLMNSIFAYFVSHDAPVYFPGAAMLLGGVMTMVSCWMCYRTLKAHRFLFRRSFSESPGRFAAGVALRL